MAGGAFKAEDLAALALSKDTLQERVYNHVRELILDGSIVPGQMVTVQSLANVFGVSAMPVREALRRLSAANALTVVSGRSIGIPPLTRDRLVDLRNVRYEIEPIAAAWAADRREQEDIEICSAALQRLHDAELRGDSKGYVKANYAFHFAVYRAARSKNILGIIENLWLQISPYFNMLHGSGNYTTSNEWHRKMLEALIKRDKQGLTNALRADIDAAYVALDKIL
jgi:DNA-binding GntR family transcriptional regulator